MSGLTVGQTYVEGGGLLRLCADGDGEATITGVTFDELENLQVTGWATLPQVEVLGLPETEDVGTLEGQGYDRTSHGVSTPCDPSSGPGYQTYLAVELRRTGDVDLVLCADEADCEGASAP